jgi:hypothetical protein
MTPTITYSDHARRWMKRRGITGDDVAAAIEHPGAIYPGWQGRTMVRAMVRGRLLCLVLEDHDGDILVVTVYSVGEDDPR